MYQRKLVIVLSVFLALVVVQTLATLWSFHTLNQHNERSRAAQQMLTHIVHFRADAKRLQVWLADFIITEKRDFSLRDELFQRMSFQLQQIDRLNETVFASSPFQSDPDFSARVNQKSLFLRENMTALEQALQSRQINQLHSDAERWQTLVTLVDKFQGSDIASIVYDLTQLHTDKSIQADEDAAAMSRFLLISLVSVSVISLALFISMSLYLTRQLSQSLGQLSLGAERIKQADFSQPIPETGSREFAHLAKAFNQMSESLKESMLQQKRLQNVTEEKVQERTAQLQHVVNQLYDAELRQKGFIAEVSHELRTPTTIIMGEAELALRLQKTKQGEAATSFERILECCQTLKSRIDDLIMLSKGQHALVSVKLDPVSPKGVYELLLQQIESQTSHRSGHINYPDKRQSLFESTSMQCLIDVDKLTLVFRILIENAWQYQEGTPYLDIEIALENQQLMMRLKDQGIGLTTQEQASLFQRHHRGQRASELRPEGLGIGLCIAKSIMDAHDGLLRLVTNHPQGVTAEISLPLFDLGRDSS